MSRRHGQRRQNHWIDLSVDGGRFAAPASRREKRTPLAAVIDARLPHPMEGYGSYFPIAFPLRWPRSQGWWLIVAGLRGVGLWGPSFPGRECTTGSSRQR